MTTTQALPNDPEISDGRRRRSERSKQKIASAMIDLIMEGDLSPSAEAVAERAEVGLRSVFRHFKDMDSLFVEMSKIFRERNSDLFDRTFESKTWQGQLTQLMQFRAKSFERILPMLQASQLSALRSEFVKGQQAANQQNLRQSLLGILPDELAKDAVLVESLDAVLCSDFWLRLRIDQNLSPAKARAVVESTVTAILNNKH